MTTKKKHRKKDGGEQYKKNNLSLLKILMKQLNLWFGAIYCYADVLMM